MTPFPKGTYVKDEGGSFRLILEELGDMRFLSYYWHKDDATSKYAHGLLNKERAAFPHTLRELETLYTPVSASEAGFEEERWVPEIGEPYRYLASRGTVFLDTYTDDNEDRFRLRSNNVFRTEEEALARYKEIMGEN